MEKILAVSSKTKYIPTPWTNNSTGYFPKRNESICSQRGMYRNAYSSFFHNSPKLETAEMSTNRRMDKEIVVYLHNETLSSRESNKLPIHSMNLKTSPMNLKNVKWKTPSTEEYKLYDAIHEKFNLYEIGKIIYSGESTKLWLILEVGFLTSAHLW